MSSWRRSLARPYGRVASFFEWLASGDRTFANQTAMCQIGVRILLQPSHLTAKCCAAPQELVTPPSPLARGALHCPEGCFSRCSLIAGSSFLASSCWLRIMEICAAVFKPQGIHCTGSLHLVFVCPGLHSVEAIIQRVQDRPAHPLQRRPRDADTARAHGHGVHPGGHQLEFSAVLQQLGIPWGTAYPPLT